MCGVFDEGEGGLGREEVRVEDMLRGVCVNERVRIALDSARYVWRTGAGGVLGSSMRERERPDDFYFFFLFSFFLFSYTENLFFTTVKGRTIRSIGLVWFGRVW